MKFILLDVQILAAVSQHDGRCQCLPERAAWKLSRQWQGGLAGIRNERCDVHQRLHVFAPCRCIGDHFTPIRMAHKDNLTWQAVDQLAKVVGITAQ